MAQILQSDYETVTAVCERCGARCVFNRIADIGHPGPYAGRSVTCLHCSKDFWISGDLINPAYDLFISSAREHFEAKRYMVGLASLAQAWELFFSAFVYSNYLYHPYFMTTKSLAADLESFNQLNAQLHHATKNFTFAPLRSVLVTTILKRVHPETLQMSKIAISRISRERFDKDPRDADIDDFPDAATRSLLKGLKQLRIGQLRNKVVHHEAYRPRQEEVEKCREEIKLLRDTEHGLRVYSYDKYSVIRARRSL